MFCIIGLVFGVQAHCFAGNVGFIAIIIDDLGSNASRTEELIQLPAELTYSFLPHTPYAEKYAKYAHHVGKEVMLHLPMEPLSQKNMGAGGLTLDMNQKKFITTLREAVSAIPFAVGLNNHMGSLLTQSEKNMSWLMRALKEKNNLYFVDSRTHGETVAAKMANLNNLKHTSRDFFLDHVVEKKAIDSQFKRLLHQVKYKGHALAIGHPHRLTIQALTRWIGVIKKQGIEIVPVSKYIYLVDREKNLWQASLALTQKFSKN